MAGRTRRIAVAAALVLLGGFVVAQDEPGVEPRAYLGQAARRAIRNPGTVILARDFK